MNYSEKFIEKNIAELSREYDKICGANKNLARVVPTYIDSCKPVARRLLYIMYLKDQGKTFRKVATITGDVIGRIHHHGPSSVYSCLVNLAQWWNNNIPLITGDGNFGTVSGDEAGADRYIYAKLSNFAFDCFFADWRESAVDMVLGADEETYEPLYLPAKYPIILLNGTLGIGYGLGANIPPFNFKDVVTATIKLMKNPDADILLIPDSPTGCDIVEGNFKKTVETGSGVYTMRCKYEVDAANNIITILALPYQTTVNSVRARIADIKENNGLPELINMQDHSVSSVDLRLYIRDDVNPYKFMRKLISEVAGLERTYPVNITVIDDFKSYDWSIKKLLIEWIKYRREQKRIIINHKRTNILADQRTNDVKIFLMSEHNLDRTIALFRSSRNRKDIEQRLIDEYKNSEIRMDSLQAKALSDMRLHELTIESYEKCVEYRGELIKELDYVEKILDEDGGIDRLIIDELNEGVKKYGVARRSNVVPYQITVNTDVSGECMLELSSDGMIIRRTSTNVDEEPVPSDINGFAVKVHNDSSFIAVDTKGDFSFISVKELPVDQEVPLLRYIKRPLTDIVALLPYDIDSNACCTLISKNGVIKKFKISEMRPSKKPCIDITKDDKIVRGIITKDIITHKDILIFTQRGYGQRLDPNNIKLTSFAAKGMNGFNLDKDDEIVGCYAIDPNNNYLLYVTMKGKARLNLAEFLPVRDSKRDAMVRLIALNDRDHLLSVIGCNRSDKLQLFFNDGTDETINIKNISEGTMSSPPEKVVSKNMVSTSVLKVKLL
jgi:DNA gyrase subunit A